MAIAVTITIPTVKAIEKRFEEENMLDVLVSSSRMFIKELFMFFPPTRYIEGKRRFLHLRDFHYDGLAVPFDLHRVRRWQKETVAF